MLDLGLPDGSGVDFCEEVKRDVPEVPAGIVSAYPDLIDPDELLARIDQVLQGRAARRRAAAEPGDDGPADEAPAAPCGQPSVRGRRP